MKLLAFLTLTLPIALSASAETIKIASWNIEHLRASEGMGKNPRHADDFHRLRQYAALLDADIVALQEIESELALAKVFDPNLYRFYVSERNGKQRTAFAVRHTVPAERHPDLEALNTTGGLRHGVDIEIFVGKRSIRLLAVHLKAFCFKEPLPEPDIMGNACEKLASQIPKLERWIDERAAIGTPFVVLGDFNRRFDEPGDDFWSDIDDGEPNEIKLSRATEGRISECWGGEFPRYIDHIVYDLQVGRWVVSESFHQLLYTEPESMKKLLSDHCPIAVTLDVPPSD
ncbi:MAG: endonuclease/exonuclease/phosphatase family protein [Boseongicola sp.]|nr:endonuclease/exonuclease/phosphatase family protein [Boseongicola sp.]